MSLPFAFLLVGFILSKQLKKWADGLIRFGLVILLAGMGVNVGSDQKLLNAIPRLGFESLLYCFFTCLVSICLVLIWEKRFFKGYTYAHAGSKNKDVGEEYKFITLVIICLFFGIVIGRQTDLLSAQITHYIIESALVAIYIGIGITMRFALKRLASSKKSLYIYGILPILITIGSVLGGIIAGYLSGQNLKWSAAIGGGMTYYSLATAMITDRAGLNIGLIAFISNFMREILTFFFAPIIARYSNMAPIAMGATSTMDTTLTVMRESLPEKYTLVAFFNGVILSFIVPLVLFIILQ
ncbi:MAG TPA: hypothetical protein DD811_05420 [Syntrophomonas sp.]|nr:hypothetical protein [Syntrophomonas sp.]